MQKEHLSDIATLILRVGLATVFFYFGIEKLIHLQANASVITQIGVPVNPIFFTIFYAILEVVVGSFLLIGLFTRITAGVASIMVASVILTFWFKLHIFLPRDIGIVGATIFLIFNGGGRLGLDRIVRVRNVFES